MVKIASLPLLALASGAAAQFPFPFWPFPRPQAGVQAPQAPQAVWGQCGGRNWNGPTSCSAGTYCKNDGNEWYSQCVPLTQDSPQRQPGNPQVITTIITVTRDGPLAPTRPVGNPNPVQPLVPPFPPAVTGTPLGQPDSPINRFQANVDDINEPAAAVPEAAVPEAAVPEAAVPEAAVPEADAPAANVPEASIAARATRTFIA